MPLGPLDCIANGPDVHPAEENPQNPNDGHGAIVNIRAEPATEIYNKDPERIAGTEENQPEFYRSIEVCIDDVEQFHGNAPSPPSGNHQKLFTVKINVKQSQLVESILKHIYVKNRYM